MRDKFLDKFKAKLESRYSFEYKILLEIIIKNLDEEKIKKYFRGAYGKLFNIILELREDPIDTFWESEFVGHIGEALSSEYLKKLGETIKSKNLDKFLDLHLVF